MCARRWRSITTGWWVSRGCFSRRGSAPRAAAISCSSASRSTVSMPTPVVPMQYEDDIDLLRYGRFLLSYWILLLAFAIAGPVVGVWLAPRAPTLCQATAILTVAPTAGGGAAALTPATSRALLANLTLVAETMKQVGITTISPQAFVQDALVVQQVPTTTRWRSSVSLPDPSQARRAADALARKAMAL